ncbi:ATP-binding cassette sub-family D member 1 [Phymastichus coffea]|uniref:ATP-binding cassette sub-family D member 1 n=1 Tax=Phymastichus coffea TaxID=108790 RepID=UPI00273C86A7|nr:ATP-binding cassette sub-family D member 1 [Phymastichus coffea]
MTSVLSKLIDRTSSKYHIRQEQLTRGVVGAVTALYLLKVGYPYLAASAKVCLAQVKGLDNAANAAVSKVQNNNNNNNNVKKKKRAQEKRDEAKDKKLAALGLDNQFIKQLLMLLKIMIPGWRTKEAGLLTCATVTLLARTFLSVYVATLEGQIVKRIVLRDVWGFFWMLTRWLAVAFPATFVNSAIRYLEGRLALSFRERLVSYAYNMYFNQQTYYRVAALDTRLGGAEQRLTDDLSELASSVAHLYSSLTKPLLDCALVGIALISFSHRMGAKTIPGPLLSVVVIALTGQILRLASPRFGQLVAEEASRKGRLREAHARISAHAEEIAFYGGHKAEHRYLTRAYKQLTMHLRKILALKLGYVMLEQFLMKYVWSGTGLVVIALPLLASTNGILQSKSNDGDGGVSERTRYLTTSKHLLTSGADAVERLMSSYKEIVALAGYVARVSEMLDVFKDAQVCKYHRNVVTTCQTRTPNGTTVGSQNLEFKDGLPIIKGTVRDSEDGSISLIDVPIVTPNCEVIVSSLTLKIRPGDHTIITGPNGCGKSSLFRIVSGLWPAYGGILVRPGESYSLKTGRPALFYIPQKPYMTVGCLRDQITYPAEVSKDESIDEELLELLELVDLRGLVEREPDGLDAVGDWDSTLSGGEKQRLAMTRLFYHAPQYALLDECSSAVSLEAEGAMYETAKKKGITLLTITHRVASLSKYHKFILRFDGEGGWNFGPLDVEKVAVIAYNEKTAEETADRHCDDTCLGESSVIKWITFDDCDNQPKEEVKMKEKGVNHFQRLQEIRRMNREGTQMDIMTYSQYNRANNA